MPRLLRRGRRSWSGSSEPRRSCEPGHAIARRTLGPRTPSSPRSWRAFQERAAEAFCGYESAADAARKAGLLPLESIAARLAIKLSRSSGFDRATRSWPRDHHDANTQWGATALLSKTETSTAEARVHSAGMAGAFSKHPEQLDVLTAIKASQALSRETTVDGLTQALLRVVLEHAGAQRAVLLLVQAGVLRPEGGASIEGETTQELPESIVRYVERTCKAIVLADASTDPTFGEDAYFVQVRGRSVLCLPILVHSRIVGVLYLCLLYTSDAADE